MALLDDSEFMGDSSQEPQGVSDDEFFGQGESAPAAQAQGGLSDEEFFDGSEGGSPAAQAAPQGQRPAPGEEWSPAGSAAAGAAHGAAPTIGGMLAGFRAGAAVAPVATALAAPLGPAAPFVGGAAGIVAGLGVGLGVGKILEMGEDKFLALLGFDKDLENARASNPDTYDIAGTLTGAATLRGGGTLAARAIGAGIGGAAEIGAQAMGDEPWNLKKILATAGMGAALPNPNKLGEAAISAGERAGTKFSSDFVSARYRGGNKNPDLKPVADETSDQSNSPAPQEEDITVANDQPIVAAGIATEQPPAPEVPGVGNPGQAAGSKAEAARPSDPERNYGLDQPQTHPEISDNKVLDATALGADTEAALVPAQRETPGETAPANGASETGAPVTAPASTDVLPQEPSPTIAPEQDNHTPRVKAEAQIPETLGPEETSRAQRERVSEVQERMAGEQQGEDFQGLPGADTQAALTPEQLQEMHRGMKMLVDHGWTKGVDALNNLRPQERFQYVREAVKDELSKEGTAAAKMTMRPSGQVRPENRVTMDTGATAKDHATGVANQEAINKYREAMEKWGPRSEQGQKFDASDVTNGRATKAYTKPLWDQFVKHMGGDPFAKGSKLYVPRVRDQALNETIEYWRSVKRSATRNEHAPFMAAHEASKKAAGGMADLDAEKAFIENDKYGVSTADMAQDVLDRKMNEAKAGQDTGRQDIEPFDNSKGDESPRVAEQHQELRDWVNGLDDDAYAALKGKHPELESNLRATQDPEELLRNFKDDIPAGTEVRLKPRRLKLPTYKPETRDTVTLTGKDGKVITLPRAKATEGKVLDKNSEEFKQKAAEALASFKDTPASRKGRLESELAAANKGDDRVDPTSELATRKAIDGTDTKPLMEHVQRYIDDTSGAGRMPEFFKKMFNDPANPSTPGASEGAIDYAKDLDKGFHAMGAKIKNLKVEIMAQLNKAAKAGLTPAEHREIAIAEQDNRTGALPQKLKDFYTEQVVPVRERAMQAMRDFKEFDDENKLGHDLPNLNAVTTKAYQPRFRLDKDTFNRGNDDRFDPFTGKGLGDFSPNLEDRKLFALEKGPERMTAEVTKDPDTGEVGLKIHRSPKRVITVKDLPASFEGKLGDSLSLHVKGEKGTWTLDQATTQELAKATGLAHIENPVLAWTKMLDSVTQAHEQAKLALAIRNDPKFEALTTTDPAVAKERGYSTVTTHLPQFMTGTKGRKLYMADQVRWAMDDFHKPGFGPGNEALEGLRNFNIAMLKVFNTNAPLVHVLNELDLFTVGRGFKWISPTAYYNLAKNAPIAFKSVNTQDAIQARMRAAGVNPMLASVKMRGMYEKSAKQMGIEIEKEHSKWDPVARAWGVSAKELGQSVYDASSDVTWRLSDYLTTMRFLEEEAGGDFGRAPKSPEEAGAAVNKFMSDYSLATTVMGSRKIAQFLAEPAVTAFGRYKAGIFRSIGHMTRDLLSPNATKQERIDAVGQWLVMGALLYVAYPAMDAAVQKLTGNEGGELRRRGVTSVFDAAKNIRSGAKDFSAAATRAYTPAPWLTIAKEVGTNQSYGGKPIIPQGEWPGVLPDAVGAAAEYAAGTVAPPYAEASRAYSRKEGTAGGAAGAFLAGQLGVATPSDAANKRADQIEKVNNQTAKQRLKRPNGMIPAAVNRVFND